MARVALEPSRLLLGNMAITNESRVGGRARHVVVLPQSVVMITIHTVVLAAALLVCSTSAAAQEPLRPPVTGAAAMDLIHKGEGVPVILTLRQLDGPVSRAVQDDLADSLVAFVLANPVVTSDRRGPADAAISSLVEAAIMGERGTPYAGAGERLLRIAYAVDRRSAGLLGIIAQLPDRQTALTLLREFATSSHEAASVAVSKLGEMGPDGVVVLRTLWDAGTITEPRARRQLERAAHHHGWLPDPRRPDRRPPDTEGEHGMFSSFPSPLS